MRTTVDRIQTGPVGRALSPPGWRFTALLLIHGMITATIRRWLWPLPAVVGCSLGILIAAIWIYFGVWWLGSLLLQYWGTLTKPPAVGRWCWEPFVVLGFAFASRNTDLPFLIARPALEHYAARLILSSDESPPPPVPRVLSWLGFGDVTRLRRRVFVHMYMGGGLFDEQGLAWCPEPPPGHDSSGEFEHFLGDWYTWYGF